MADEKRMGIWTRRTMHCGTCGKRMVVDLPDYATETWCSDLCCDRDREHRPDKEERGKIYIKYVSGDEK